MTPCSVCLVYGAILGELTDKELIDPFEHFASRFGVVRISYRTSRYDFAGIRRRLLKITYYALSNTLSNKCFAIDEGVLVRRSNHLEPLSFNNYKEVFLAWIVDIQAGILSHASFKRRPLLDDFQ